MEGKPRRGLQSWSNTLPFLSGSPVSLLREAESSRRERFLLPNGVAFRKVLKLHFQLSFHGRIDGVALHVQMDQAAMLDMSTFAVHTLLRA